MSGQSYFAEHLAYIAKVTQMLNELTPCKDFYIHVELREEGTHTPVGEWSDEIAPDCWYYEEKSN